jgi:tetratricopeptide (TPR) repeat protein
VKAAVIILSILITAAAIFIFTEKNAWMYKPSAAVLRSVEGIEYQENRSQLMSQGLELLKARRDNEALEVFDQVLSASPCDIDAMWGKAEVLRRKREFKKAQAILDNILEINPKHAPSLIIFSYIHYKNGRLDAAQGLIQEIFNLRYLDKADEAMAYMILGSINAKRSANGGIISKIRYGTQIEGYFLKAETLAPDLPEIHMALGTFYLLAPSIAGGNMKKAMNELKTAVLLAPDFATANARLAQAYSKNRDYANYGVYITRAKELDPDNEAVKEIEEGR